MNEQEKEVLNITIEECSELTMAITKIFRFGWDSTNPENGIKNCDQFVEELAQVRAMADLIYVNMTDANKELFNSNYMEKFNRLKKWSSIEHNYIDEVLK
jgi:hypothetical protein